MLAGQRRYFTRRWIETILPNAVEKDDRSADEIAADIIQRAGLSVDNGGE